MDNVTLRLIYPRSLPQQHLLAARAGLEPFKDFNVQIESRCAIQESAYRRLRYPKLLRSMALAERNIRLRCIDPDSPVDISHNVFGIVLTPYLIIPGTDRRESISALGGYMTGAVVSLGNPLLLQDPGPIISAMVKYNASKLLIPSEGPQTAATIA